MKMTTGIYGGPLCVISDIWTSSFHNMFIVEIVT